MIETLTIAAITASLGALLKSTFSLIKFVGARSDEKNTVKVKFQYDDQEVAFEYNSDNPQQLEEIITALKALSSETQASDGSSEKSE